MDEISSNVSKKIVVIKSLASRAEAKKAGSAPIDADESPIPERPEPAEYSKYRQSSLSKVRRVRFFILFIENWTIKKGTGSQEIPKF